MRTRVVAVAAVCLMVDSMLLTVVIPIWPQLLVDKYEVFPFAIAHAPL